MAAYGVIGKSELLHKFGAVNISTVKDNRMAEIPFNHVKIRTAENKPLGHYGMHVPRPMARMATFILQESPEVRVMSSE